MIKLIAGLIVTVVCLALALVPELGMYILWNIIGPTEEVSRMVLGICFFFFGGGACIGFGFLGMALWAAMIAVILD